MLHPTKQSRIDKGGIIGRVPIIGIIAMIGA
jgi:hypothetical protein